MSELTENKMQEKTEKKKLPSCFGCHLADDHFLCGNCETGLKEKCIKETRDGLREKK